MSLILAALASTVTTTMPPARPCKPEAQVAGAKSGMKIRRLGEMPPAKQVLGVYRERNGCTEPIVVRERSAQHRRTRNIAPPFRL